ncbi:uncharacterized protein LOC129192700 [Dunckerocampus dactyliophorus]|uniref:uncharacterized protein LOC129192700 n=1 Tax=Dunckerocampus dactyliophorus TaxID=161453 RepID=UPI002405DC69|nr:uncharacterized protein LOC129192700 [Dunckerocampus dactyliophorus]XP_054652969.1 uncharacterized protein LOC129192700 [Dunckerocampus dactyliophorus]XP_054652977.1 uncharacterized protein LOC129192700 [Dunckerocampus dactyliophorus]
MILLMVCMHIQSLLKSRRTNLLLLPLIKPLLRNPPWIMTCVLGLDGCQIHPEDAESEHDSRHVTAFSCLPVPHMPSWCYRVVKVKGAFQLPPITNQVMEVMEDIPLLVLSHQWAQLPDAHLPGMGSPALEGASQLFQSPIKPSKCYTFHSRTLNIQTWLMTNSLMSSFNMKGHGSKRAFQPTELYAIVTAAVKRWDSKATDHEISRTMADHFKHGPGRWWRLS